MTLEYIDTKYKPKNELICEYYLEPSKGISIEKACEHIALTSFQSIKRQMRSR